VLVSDLGNGSQDSAIMPQKNNSLNNSEKLQNAYFHSLELENVRCLAGKQKIDFSDTAGKLRQWTIILGDNGTGKTTILQSIVAMFPVEGEFPIDEDGISHEKVSRPMLGHYHFREKCNFFRKPIERTSITAHLKTSKSLKENSNIGDIFTIRGENYVESDFEDEAQITVSPIETWCSFHVTRPIHQVKFAYGASRKAGETSLTEDERNSAFNTLFDETAFLVNPEEWLLQADYAAKRGSGSSKKRQEELEFVIGILKKILPDVDNIRFNERQSSGRTPKPIVEFHTPYGWVESKDLSLGYRTSMAWMVDFASRMFALYPESENPLAEPAVVLIDEIDLHLHPKWQRELIDYLTNLFPNTQFIVTTHSPLIVQAAAARDANIVVCRREGDHVVIDQSVEAVKNWRADQILTSELFDLPTARPKEIEKLLKEKEDILSKPKLTKRDEKRLEELEEEIGFLPVSESHEDNEAMEVIRDAADWLKTQAK
jgi:predicted ATP-binding protein involved in virulence